MPTRCKEKHGKEQGSRFTVPFIVGFLLGLGFGASSVFFLFVFKGYASTKKTTSANGESVSHAGVDCPNLSNTAKSSLSLDRAAIKSAVLAAQIAEINHDADREKENNPRGLRQKEEERTREMDRLRAALPGNYLLPEKTQEDLRKETERLEEEADLTWLILEEEATTSELDDYYKLKAKRYQDEIAALDFCEKHLREAAEKEETPLGFCIDINATDTADRRRASEDSLALLQRAYQEGFPYMRKGEVDLEWVAKQRASIARERANAGASRR